MNELHAPKITPKNVVLAIGAILVLFVVYIFVYSLTRTETHGLYGTVNAPPARSFITTQKTEMYRNALGAPMVAYEMDSVESGAVASGDASVTLTSSAPSSVGNMLIRTGNLSLVVTDIDQTVARIEALILGMEGFVTNTNFREFPNGSHFGAMTIRVPAERFSEAMKGVKQFALQVENESSNSEDVTEQYDRYTAQVKNLRVTEAQIVEIMKRSGTINEILNVNRELSNTRREIEQLEATIARLSTKVALSTITVSLRQEVIPGETVNEWRPVTVVKEGMKQTLSDMTNFVDMILFFLVRLPALLLNLAFWALIIWGLYRFGVFLFHRLRKAGQGV